MDQKSRYLGQALIYFFTHAQLNIYQGNTYINLMDLFPTLKNGYANCSTMQSLFRVYIRMNQIDPSNFIISDNLFKKSFNGDIPADFYICAFDRGGMPKIQMDEAINRGYIENNISTFQNIKRVCANFNENKFRYRVLDIILEANSIQINVTNDLLNRINNEEILARALIYIINNQTIIDNGQITIANFISQIEDEISTMYEEIQEYTHYNEDIQQDVEVIKSLIYALICDSWFKLLYSIILQDVDMVKRCLSVIDPRVHNNEAYILALKMCNDEIITILTDYILARNWIEQQALEQVFEQLIGPSDIPKTIFLYGTQNTSKVQARLMIKV